MRFFFFFILMNLSALYSEYQAKDFSYLIGKTKCLSEQTLKLHLTLYNGYVKNTNELIKILNQMDKKGEQSSLAYGALKRRLGWEFDGMRLHELYFDNLGAQEPIDPESTIYKEIKKHFGSYENWVKSFKSTALIRGIGWVILYKDPSSGILYNAFVSEHDVGHLATCEPLCVVDVWEHAYMTQYGLEKASYIDAFMKEIRWSVVQERLIKTSKSNL